MKIFSVILVVLLTSATGFANEEVDQLLSQMTALAERLEVAHSQFNPSFEIPQSLREAWNTAEIASEQNAQRNRYVVQAIDEFNRLRRLLIAAIQRILDSSKQQRMAARGREAS